MTIEWQPITNGYHYFAYIAGFRVEKYYDNISNQFLYCIGEKNDALIKFTDPSQILKFLTI